jgi:hypothetical protein
LVIVTENRFLPGRENHAATSRAFANRQGRALAHVMTRPLQRATCEALSRARDAPARPLTRLRRMATNRWRHISDHRRIMIRSGRGRHKCRNPTWVECNACTAPTCGISLMHGTKAIDLAPIARK